MNYNIEAKPFCGGSLPTVYIHSIELGIGEDLGSKKDKDVHIKSRSKNKNFSSRNSNSVINGAMQCKIKFTIPIIDTLSMDKIRQESKYYKILMVQCTKKSMHDSIKANPYRHLGGIATNLSTRDFEAGSLQTKILSLEEIIKQFDITGKNYLTDVAGNAFCKIPFETRFTIDESSGGSTIPFLSYFAFCFFDHQQKQQDSGVVVRSTLLSSGLMMCGKISSEKVIENSKVIRNATAFKDNNGYFWTGQVHQMKNGTWMKYSYHSHDNNDSLKKMMVHNTKIKDHRIMRALQSLSFEISGKNDFTVKDSKIVDQLRKDGNLDLIKKNKSIFSDLYISRDSSNRGRFMFSINMGNLIKEGTEFSQILSNLKHMDKQSYHNILEKVRIENIEIKRDRARSNNRLESKSANIKVEDDKLPVLIAKGRDAVRGHRSFSSPLVSSSLRDPGNISTPPALFGIMKEINIDSGAVPSTEVRHFTGTDFDVAKQKKGSYRYHVDIRFENPIISYIQSVLQSLDNLIEGNSVIAGMEQYYKDSLAKQTYYDQYSDQFNVSFLEFYNSKYNDNGNLVFSSIESLIKIFYVFSRDLRSQNISMSEVMNYLANICSPNCGSPDGINRTLLLMKNTRNKLSNLLAKNTPYIRLREGSNVARDSTNSTTSQRALRSNSTSHIFEDMLELDAIPSVGYDYLFPKLNEIEKNNDGLCMLAKDKIIERFNIESDKYFKSQDADIKISNNQNDVFNQGDAIKNSKFSFLSVSNIYMNTDSTDIRYSNINPLIKETSVAQINDVLTEVSLYNKNRQQFFGQKTHADIDNSYQNLLESFNCLEGASIGERTKTRTMTPRLEIFSYDAGAEEIDRAENLFIVNEKRSLEQNSVAKKLMTALNRQGSEYFDSDENSLKFYFINDSDGAETFKKELTLANGAERINNLNQRGTDKVYYPLNRAPNQLKALLLSVQKSPSVNLDKPFADLADNLTDSKDIFKNYDNSGLMYYKYKNLREVMVFKGYKNTNGNISLKDPIWETMSKKDLDSSTSEGLLFCKHIPYVNNTYGIHASPEYELPSYNDFFLIEGTTNVSKLSRVTDGDRSVISSAEKGLPYDSIYSAGSIIATALNSFFSRREKNSDPKILSKNPVVKSDFISTEIIIKKVRFPQIGNQPVTTSGDDFESTPDMKGTTRLKNEIVDLGLKKLLGVGYNDATSVVTGPMGSGTQQMQAQVGESSSVATSGGSTQGGTSSTY